MKVNQIDMKALCIFLAISTITGIVSMGCSDGTKRSKQTGKTGDILPVTWKEVFRERKMYSDDAQNPVVEMETNMGVIRLELFPEKAPLTVANFLRYVDEEFYTNTVFHRVIKDFMIQGGVFTEELKPKEPNEPIVNEATNGLSNLRGTLAMARPAEVHEATSQFYINLVDNDYLDHKNKTDTGFGYCVFGGVIEGMDIVEEIGNVRTGRSKGMQDVPKKNVVIKSVKSRKSQN